MYDNVCADRIYLISSGKLSMKFYKFIYVSYCVIISFKNFKNLYVLFSIASQISIGIYVWEFTAGSFFLSKEKMRSK